MALSFASGLKKLKQARASHALPQAEYIAATAQDYARLLPDLLLEARTRVQSLRHGPYNQRRSGQGDSFWQYRPYEQGDSIRQVDWKATAKHGEALILQKEDEQIQNMVVHCPFTAAMDFAPQGSLKETLGHIKDNMWDQKAPTNLNALPAFITTKFSAGLFLSACLMSFFQTQRHPFTTTAGDPHRLSVTEDHFLSQLDHLCSSTNNSPSLHSTNRHIMWIGDFWGDNETLENELIALQEQGSIPYLIQIITRDELALPYKGHILCENIDGDGHVDIPLVEGIADEYKSRINAHLTHMDELCTKMGIYHARLVMGVAPTDSLPHRAYRDINELLEDMMAAVAIPRSGIMA